MVVGWCDGVSRVRGIGLGLISYLIICAGVAGVGWEWCIGVFVYIFFVFLLFSKVFIKIKNFKD